MNAVAKYILADPRCVAALTAASQKLKKDLEEIGRAAAPSLIKFQADWQAALTAVAQASAAAAKIRNQR